MPNFPSLLKKKWFPIVAAILILVIANIAVFWQFYFKGLLPIPGDLLVSFFFPWSGGGFPGFDSWTTHKSFILSDTIRQMYPWKVFIFESLRSGHLPLWNPHNFSGYPFFGNLQSSFLFPGNILFFIFNPLTSWMILVISLLSLFGFFNYLFLRSLKLSFPASIFGALVGSTLSYLVVWHEQLIMIQVVIFLPLVLWSINNYSAKKHPALFFFLIPLMLCFAIFGGHAQTYIYLNFIIGPYLLMKKVPIKTIIFFLVTPIFLGAVQLLPTIENYFHSAREGISTQDLFDPFVLPWKHLATIFAADYFGNPATGNYSSVNYGEFQAFFTVSGVTLSAFALFRRFSDRTVQLFIILAILGIAFATWPFAYLYKNIPIMGSSAPSRFIFLFQFSGIVLSAYGLDALWKNLSENSRHKNLIPLVLIALVYVILWGAAFFVNNSVAMKNLVLPSGIFFMLFLAILTRVSKIIPIKISRLALLIAIPLVIFEASFFLNKYSPFSSRQFVFPPHPVINFLKDKAGYDRFYGTGTAYFDNNFATYYQIYSTEGYDSLMTKRYEQLLSSTENGKLTNKIHRSDAVFPTIDNSFKNKTLDILGVKFFLYKDDMLKGPWNPDLNKFPQDKYSLVWQKGKWQIYQRNTALPRVLLTSQYEVISNDDKLLSRFYEPDFNHQQTLLLSQKPNFPSHKGSGEANIISYFPDTIEVEVNSQTDSLLYLSDSFFPGWTSSVDNVQTPIFQANYNFRAVPVPSGKHTVTFNYSPLSVKSGAILSILSLIGLIISTYFYRKKQKNA